MNRTISHNINKVTKRIDSACRRVGRNPNDISMVLATKTVDPDRILEAARLGYTKIGENRVQEAEQKIERMGIDSENLEWHFIGHLQSNKVNKVVAFASMIESIDRLKIVRKLNRRLIKMDKTMDVLIQVNTSGENSKYGIHPSEIISFVKKVASYDRVCIKGLMTIGLFSDDWPKIRAGFRMLRELRELVKGQNIPGVEMNHLSMGMTNDFEIAIEEGATMIRLGRAIFGRRDTPDCYYWPGIDSHAANEPN